MDKKLTGLIGALAAVAPLGATQAASPLPQNTFAPSSFADLLAPIPNAGAKLEASDALLSERANQAKVEQAQYYHHHHHHHFFHRRSYHHHHHHNHIVGRILRHL